MSEMVERVARALYEADASNSSVRWESWPENKDRARKGLRIKCGKYRDRARAAIEAMREPTSEMIDAAWNEAETQTEQAQEVWCAMINAALTETDPVAQGN